MTCQYLFLAILLLLCLLTTLATSEPIAQGKEIRNPSYLPIISDQGYQKQWETMCSDFDNPEYNNLVIKGVAVTKDGLEKLFKKDMKYVRRFHMDDVNFNGEMAEFLFNQSRFYQFQIVLLSNCNLFCQDFANLPTRNTNITKLSLQKNSISTKGFQYLTRLSMNLTSLILDETSLIDDEAVDALIMLSLKNIEILSLCGTSISGFNLLRVLKELDRNKLQKLLICTNSFPVSFYSQFSKFNFTKLNHLNLNDLNIDEEGFQILENMSFPSLQYLMLQRNQLTTETACKFITKSRMPNLHSISIDGNFLNATFLQHLKNQQFTLQFLSCNINKMNLNGLTYITELNTSNMTVLYYGARSTTPQIMRDFILKTDFDRLEQLYLMEMQNTEDYFKYMLSRKWPKLERLWVKNVQIIDNSIYETNETIFPSLRQLDIQFQTADQEMIYKFVRNIQKIAPNLTEISIKAPVAAHTINAVINGSLAHSLTKNISVMLITQFPFQAQFGILLSPTEMCQVRYISLPHTFINCLVAKGQSLVNLKEITESTIRDFLDMLAQIASLQSNLHRNFDFSKLIFLHESNQLNFVKNLLSNNGGKYTFRYLDHLQLQIDENTPLQLLTNFSFPALLMLTLKKSNLQQQQVDDIELTALHNKFHSLRRFYTDLWIDKNQIKQFFKSSLFKNLEYLSMARVRNIKPQDLQQIHSSIQYLSRIRQLEYEETFINNDLTFLAKTKIKPLALRFNNIVFRPDVIQQLCDIDFEFIIGLQMTNVGADDKAITGLITCLQNKLYDGKKRSIHFPKLKNARFNDNYIGSEGIGKFMNTQMPLLEEVNFDRNVDSEIFNSVFRSPWSRRINKFISTQRKSGSIDPNINPKYTRRLETLEIQNAHLFDSDILTLSNLDLFSLESLTLEINKIENCQFLKSLLKLTKNVVQITIVINDSPKINSKCLIESKNDASWVQPQLLALSGNSYYGQITNFAINIIGKTSEWKSLIMENAHMPENTAISMFQNSDLSQIRMISFSSCQLSDRFVETLAKQDLSNVVEIHLDDNPLTARSMEHLFSRNLSKLHKLILSRTDIGDQGISHLIKNSYQQLQVLQLANIGLTAQGILLLNQLKAPKLAALDLSNNGLSYLDIALLEPDDFDLHQLVVYPSLRAKEAQYLHEKFQTRQGQRGLFQRHQLKIYATLVSEPEFVMEEVEFYGEEGRQEDVQ